MITNADIYLYSYDINLLKLLNSNKYVYALTRYEYDMSHPFIDEYIGSHDCYIFNSKYLDDRIICENTNFRQNLLGIESRIIKSFFDLNYTIYNPCKQIKIVHLHKTNLRNYTDSDDVALHNKNLKIWLNSVWHIPPCILELSEKICIVYSVKSNNINNILENKEYTWEDSSIKFLENNKMKAFGDGIYKIIDNFNIIANFGGREHNIKFNDDYTEFISTRKCDSCIVIGKIIV